MPRWIVWLPGVILPAAAAVALPLAGSSREAPTARTTPRVVVLSSAAETASPTTGGPRSGRGAPEIVLAGESPAGRAAAPTRASASARRARPHVIHEIVYVDAPADAPAPTALPAAAAASPAPEAIVPPPPVPPPAEAAVSRAPRSTGRTGEVVRSAAIGAGIGAILGGRKGALSGAIGGAIGGGGGIGRAGTGRGGGQCPRHFDPVSLVTR